MKFDRKARVYSTMSTVAAFLIGGAIFAVNSAPLDGRGWWLSAGVGAVCALVAAAVGIAMGLWGSRRRARSA